MDQEYGEFLKVSNTATYIAARKICDSLFFVVHVAIFVIVLVACLLSFGAQPLSSRLLPKNLKIKIYRTIILPIALYGCETWSLTLREERMLRVFENMVLRRIFGPRRDEVTGGG